MANKITMFHVPVEVRPKMSTHTLQEEKKLTEKDEAIDPFFKRIFHPDIYPDRLSRFVSSILGIKVRVVRILPNEDSLLDGGTLLIMDLLGELEDGSLVNIEIQKQGYAFPAERITCYSSDLVMRQYARVKGEKGSGYM